MLNMFIVMIWWRRSLTSSLTSPRRAEESTDPCSLLINMVSLSTLTVHPCYCNNFQVTSWRRWSLTARCRPSTLRGTLSPGSSSALLSSQRTRSDRRPETRDSTVPAEIVTEGGEILPKNISYKEDLTNYELMRRNWSPWMVVERGF